MAPVDRSPLCRLDFPLVEAGVAGNYILSEVMD